jgi:hypothetical protein
MKGEKRNPKHETKDVNWLNGEWLIGNWLIGNWLNGQSTTHQSLITGHGSRKTRYTRLS